MTEYIHMLQLVLYLFHISGDSCRWITVLLSALLCLKTGEGVVMDVTV